MRCAATVEALENLPVALPQAVGRDGYHSAATAREFQFFEGPNQVSRENGKRRVVVTANVRGRDIGSLVTRHKQRSRSEVTLPAGLLVGLGRAIRELRGARQRL